MLAEIWTTIGEELGGTGGVAEWTRVTLRLVVAALLGGVLGYERETKGKSAGLRTHMLVSLGAALFALVPSRAGWDEEAVSRVLQGLVAGIGFLGAGAIVKRTRESEPHGLTTAASIWLAAAIGMTVGLGRESIAILATILALVILAVLPLLERRIERP